MIIEDPSDEMKYLAQDEEWTPPVVAQAAPATGSALPDLDGLVMVPHERPTGSNNGNGRKGKRKVNPEVVKAEAAATQAEMVAPPLNNGDDLVTLDEQRFQKLWTATVGGRVVVETTNYGPVFKVSLSSFSRVLPALLDRL